MNSDETSRAESTMIGSSSNEGLSSVVVLVADGDPSVTDEIATVLRTRFTVRSAYDSADALASLDPERRAELEHRLSELDDRLGETVGGLDGADVYDAGLRRFDSDS